MSNSDAKFAKSIEKIIDIFASGKIPDAVAHSVIPMPDIPSAKWKGLRNRILVFVHTEMVGKDMDCRTFKQWKDVGRYPTGKGTGFDLWRPNIRKKEEEGEEKTYVTGFRSFSVFSLSDTKGKEIKTVDIEPPTAPPLIEVAEKWGVNVKYTFTSSSWGSYSPSQDAITLATHDESTFFHELAHAAHNRVLKKRGEKIQGGQHPFQEIIAELSAATLGLLVGRQTGTEGRSYRYIENYAKEQGIGTVEACRAVLDDVDQCLQLIMGDRK
jgi:hypothetical protein